ncbi:uncharacterized protein LOC128879305 [Hylaeus volcanicus]|uniref:uncharacterized protein LOC128879305 n=1 Tax=Hylaeus volcanicus TaxID=313075 RepID=UPI0023B7AA39|nr:uncharacterized protein LOC128879305 [Hylaeus volcanicus]
MAGHEEVKTVGDIEITQEIIEEVDFEENEKMDVNKSDEERTTPVTEGNNLVVSCERSSVIDIEEEMNEDIGNSMNYDCNYVVERAEPQQSNNSISRGIDFADFAYVFEQIKNLQNHSTIGCGIEHFDIIGCQQYGLEKTYNVQCRMCNHVERISCLQQNHGYQPRRCFRNNGDGRRIQSTGRSNVCHGRVLHDEKNI